MPQPIHRQRQPLLPPPALVQPNSYTASDQSASASPNNKNNRSPPVPITIPNDNEQQQAVEFRDLMRHKHQHPSDVITQRKALLPKLDLRRSHSAAEALNLMQSQFTSSTEYPYVLHASEVIGNDRHVIGSLPQFVHHSKSLNNLMTDTHYRHPVENQDNPDAITYSNIEADESNSIYDKPYADGGHVIWDLVVSSTMMGMKTSTDLNFQDYRYEEYPLNWTPAAQLAFEVGNQASEAYDCLSPEYQDIEEYHKRSGSAVPPSNGVSSLKKYNIAEQSSVPSQKPKITKPPIQPRTKLAHIHTASKQVIEPPGHVVVNQPHISVTIASDSTEMSPETLHDYDHARKLKYMKLLQSTTDEVHVYSSLVQNN